MTIIATVEPDPGSGTITWSEDGVDVGSTPVGAGGRVSIARVLMEPGPHAYTAAFSGNDSYAPSVSGPYTHVVAAVVPTTITLKASAVRAIAGTEITVTGTVAPVPASGSVTWRLAGNVLAVTILDSGGRTSVAVRVAEGSSAVEAKFDGSPGFGPSKAAIDLTGVVVPRACSDPLGTAAGHGVTADLVRSGRVTFYGITATVDPKTIDYARSPVSNASWTGYFRGLHWLVPLALDAFVSGDPEDLNLVTAYVDAYHRNPDPGSSTAQSLALAGTIGWDEATNAGREGVLNCLVQVDPSPAASWILEASIVANLDVNRYYGIPRHRPHNHGMMANLALTESARILRRPSLIDAAETRMLTDMARVMDPCGMVFEQSAPYQRHNAVLWARAAAAMDSVGRPLTAARLRGTANTMAAAYGHLIAPDGRLPAIGDGNVSAATPLVRATSTRMLCRSAGWAVARGGWTASTSWYVLRFGPARIQHGHDDHGSIAWYRGRHVLVDPGSYFEPNSTYGRWYKTNAAHNVLAARGVDISSATPLIRSSLGTGVDTYTVRDFTRGVTRTRSVRFDRSLPLVVVLDRASSSWATTFSQSWHFDPAWHWDPVRRELGWSGARSGVVAMDLRTRRSIPVAATSSWVFPSPTTVRRDPMLTVSRSGTSVSILSVVYLGASTAKPVIQWFPGQTAGTGVARIWWGRVHRDIVIDSVGMR